MKETKQKCLYDQWFEDEGLNLNQFTITIFKAFQYADGKNKAKIISSRPDWFLNSENL